MARIELGSQTYALQGRLNGKACAVLALYQLPGTNAIQAVDGVKKLMEQAKKSFPPDMDYVIALDTTQAVREGLKEIVKTLYEALILVIIVVFIFLQGWRATLIPALAVPVSLIGTFAFFPLLGFSINTIALMGLVLAIGLVVDDAIVVVEAVEHHIEQGMSPKEATLKAMEEVSGPVVAIALSLAAVFVPTIFIPGITGRLYQQFAITIAVSVIISSFNALTLTPALSALLLKPKKESRGPLSRFYRWFNDAFGRTTNGYVSWCGTFIRKAGMSLLFLALVAGLAGLLGGRLPGGFLPEEDQGYMYAGVQLPDASSLQRTSEVCRQIEEIMTNTPGIEYVTTVVGMNMLSGVTNTYSGFFFVTLKPWEERKKPEEKYEAIMASLNGKMSKLPQGVAFAFSPPAIPGIGTAGGVTFILEDRAGKDIKFLWENTQKFLAAAQKRPEALPGHHHLHPHGAPDLRQSGPGQGAQAGRGHRRGLPGPAGLHGRLLRQLLQPLRPPVAGVRAGRGGIPGRSRTAGPVLRAQQERRLRALERPHQFGTALRAGVHHALQPLPLRADQCRHRPRVQFHPGDEGPGGSLQRDHAV